MQCEHPLEYLEFAYKPDIVGILFCSCCHKCNSRVVGGGEWPENSPLFGKMLADSINRGEGYNPDDDSMVKAKDDLNVN